MIVSIILFVVESLLLSIIQGYSIAGIQISYNFSVSSIVIFAITTFLSIAMIVVNATRIKSYYYSKAKSIVGVAFASLASFIGILFLIGVIIGFASA